MTSIFSLPCCDERGGYVVLVLVVGCWLLVFWSSHLLPRNSLRLFHEQHPVPLVLKFGRVPVAYPHGIAVDMQLPDQGTFITHHLLPKCVRTATSEASRNEKIVRVVNNSAYNLQQRRYARKYRRCTYFAPRTLSPRLPQPQQPNQYILLGILVRQKSLPPSVRYIISPDQLDIVRVDLVVYLLHPHLPSSNVLAL